MKNLGTLYRELYQLQNEIATLNTDFEANKKNLETDIAEVKRLIRIENGGFDSGVVIEAEKLIYVRGYEKYYGSGETARCLSEAKNCVVHGGDNLFKGYFGCKNYESFICQRSDHPYGYGPKHGSTVFEIGLRIRDREEKKLTEDEINLILFYLNNLDKIKAREKVDS